MRFKAKLAPEQVNLLYSLIQPLSRLASSSGHDTTSSSVWLRNGSVLYLDSNHVRISAKGKTLDTDGVTCFAELKAGGGIFLEHRIESVAEHNAIVMELDLVQLKMALQSVTTKEEEGHYTILKLAKRNGMPCLCLDSAAARVLQVHQAIPVRILRAADMQLHLPPQTSLPAVQLQIPRDTHKPLKLVLEQFRTMGGATVHVQGNRVTGECHLDMDHEGASIQTRIGKWTPQHVPDHSQDQQPEDCTLKADVKKMCNALQWPPNYVSTALMCLVENEQLVLHVTLDPAVVGFFTYYVPVHYYDPNDVEA